MYSQFCFTTMDLVSWKDNCHCRCYQLLFITADKIVRLRKARVAPSQSKICKRGKPGFLFPHKAAHWALFPFSLDYWSRFSDRTIAVTGAKRSLLLCPSRAGLCSLHSSLAVCWTSCWHYFSPFHKGVLTTASAFVVCVLNAQQRGIPCFPETSHLQLLCSPCTARGKSTGVNKAHSYMLLPSTKNSFFF